MTLAHDGALTPEALARAAKRMLEYAAPPPVEYMHPAQYEDEVRFRKRLARGERIPIEELEERLRAEGWDVDALNEALFGAEVARGAKP